MVQNATKITQGPAPLDIWAMWAQYLQERRRALLTELRAVEAQQEQMEAARGQQPKLGIRQQ